MSFNIVKLIKKQAPKLKTIGIVSKKEQIFKHLDSDPDLIAPFKGIVTQGVVRLLHGKGKDAWVWTVDTAEELKYLKDCKVDGVISNRPKVMQELTRH